MALSVLLAATLAVAGAVIALGPTGGNAGRSLVPVSVRHAARPRPPMRPPVGKIGRYVVAGTSLRFIDRSPPALGARVLPTLVRYPVVPAKAVTAGKLARGPFPLVIFAPGYLQCRSSYASLLQAWASAGYVVAAVEFPRTHCYVSDPDEADLSNQPGDISVVITRLLAISARPSGVQWAPLGGRYFPRGTPPMLFVQGSADTWNPPAASIQLYLADKTGIRYYLDLPGVGHFAPYEGHGRPEPLVARATVDFLNQYLDGPPSAMIAFRSVPGVAELASGGHLPS